MAKPMMMKMDKKYQAECDMRSLMEAKAIQADKSRMAAAKKAAEEQAKKAAAVAKTLKKVK